MSRPTELTAWNKAGVTTTNANGVANVIFTNAIPYGFQYVVMLTVQFDPLEGVCAYASGLTQTGFRITTMSSSKAGPAYSPVANVIVYWMVRSVFNE